MVHILSQLNPAEVEKYCVMGCETVWHATPSAFRMSLLPLSSGSKNKPGKEPARSRQKYLLDFVFDPEDGGRNFVLNISEIWPYYTASQQYIAVYSELCEILIRQ